MLTWRTLDMKDKLDDIYQEVFADAVDYMQTYNVQQVAATYMAIAMRLYKTHLEDGDYEEMIKTALETEVKPYKKTYH